MERVKLPRDVQVRCIWLVRGYERCRRDYKEMRQAIIDGSGGHYSTYKVKVGQNRDGKPIFEERRTFTAGAHVASRTTEDKEMRLEDVERLPWVRDMRAVEHARDRIGAGTDLYMGNAEYARSCLALHDTNSNPLYTA